MAGPSTIIGASVVRFARLTASGLPDFNNPSGGFMLCGGISKFEYDFETEAGVDIFERDASGNACVIKKQQDLVKRVTFTLTLCKGDDRLDEILGIADAITDGGTVVGRAFTMAQGCGENEQFNGVSIELWSDQWDCDQALVNAPYRRTVLARAFLTPASGSMENGPSLSVYKGYSTPNSNYGDGPFGDLELLVGHTGWAMAQIDNQAVPACPTPIGYINIPGSAS